jgi:DNA-binding response OmpR family regulator
MKLICTPSKTTEKTGNKKKNTTSMNILLIEDEPKLSEFLKRGLTENGFNTEVAIDGVSGLKMAIEGKHDVIILDINLPLKNGLQVCRELRINNIHKPVLMLTARRNTEDKLHGFDAGADDYLVKPFAFLELIARVKALCKRSLGVEAFSNTLTFADMELNLHTKTASRNGKNIELTAKEFSLLEYFLRNKNRVISRGELAQMVWDIDFDTGTNVIDVYVNFLRKKIDKEFPTKLLHTQVGFGYILKEA